MALKIWNNVKAHSQKDRHQAIPLYEIPKHTTLRSETGTVLLMGQKDQVGMAED